MDPRDALEHQVGPLPVWGWIAGGIIIVGGIVVLRHRGSGTTSSAAGPSTANSAGFGTSGLPGAGAPGGQDTITGDELTQALGSLQDIWDERSQEQGQAQSAAITSAIAGSNASLTEALGKTYGNLVDYGNTHWLGSGNVGGTQQTIVPISSPGTGGSGGGTRAYTQTVPMLPEWATGALTRFIRSDTPTGLADDWQSASEGDREQLRQLISQGLAFSTPGYTGPRPV